jgi:uncharacterized membrane protein
VHILINFLILVFCFPLTLTNGQGLNGLVGMKIFNSFPYVVLILIQVILYEIIKHKQTKLIDEKISNTTTRFLNLLIDTPIIVLTVFIIRDIFFLTSIKQKSTIAY